MALLLGMSATGYAATRQWLVPNIAPALEPIDDQLEPSEIVAVTASGAVPVRLLERLRGRASGRLERDIWGELSETAAPSAACI